MTLRAITLPGKRDPTVAAIVTAWRRLTSTRPDGRTGPGSLTVVACSGGADSSALVLALAAAKAPIIVAHIVHDQRARAEALADRDAVRELSEVLGLPFAEGTARARGKRGNTEALLRAARYAELERIAREADAEYVATAHHAHDQIETVLMAMLRGAGTRGLRGIAQSRPIARGSRVRLIRPMLRIEPAEARRLCREAEFTWREDPTNADALRLRARLRTRVLPELLQCRPAAARRICESADALRDADQALKVAARRAWSRREVRLCEDGTAASIAWPRSVLADLPRAIAGLVLVRAARALGVPSRSITRRQVTEAVEACRRGRSHGRPASARARTTGASSAGLPFNLTWSGLRIRSVGHTVELERTARRQLRP